MTVGDPLRHFEDGKLSDGYIFPFDDALGDVRREPGGEWGGKGGRFLFVRERGQRPHVLPVKSPPLFFGIGKDECRHRNDVVNVK